MNQAKAHWAAGTPHCPCFFGLSQIGFFPFSKLHFFSLQQHFYENVIKVAYATIIMSVFIVYVYSSPLIKWGHGRHKESSNDRNFEVENIMHTQKCRIRTKSFFKLLKNKQNVSTLFRNCPKCLIWFSSILAFPPIFRPFKTDLSGNTVWLQASSFRKLSKMDHFWHSWITFVYSR